MPRLCSMTTSVGRRCGGGGFSSSSSSFSSSSSSSFSSSYSSSSSFSSSSSSSSSSMGMMMGGVGVSECMMMSSTSGMLCSEPVLMSVDSSMLRSAPPPMVRGSNQLFEYGFIQGYKKAPVVNIQGTTQEKAPRPVLKPEDIKEILQVVKVDFMVTENAISHHTSEFDITDPEETPVPQLVVRRGQPFNIKIEFSHQYKQDKDDLKLVFEVGGKPMASKKTHVEFILSDEDLPKQWGAKIIKQDGNVLVITIFTPPDCFVAKWNFKADVVKKTEGSKSIFRYNHGHPIYMLFNPWCKDDTVYMEGEDNLNEYVLNEIGKIYAGNQRQIEAKPWNFAQFQGEVLDCCMYLLDISEMNWASRGNPVPVCRKISGLINKCDENDTGVLVGRWDGQYADGKAPLSWMGSQGILEKFFHTKQPVKYGQCWVFSGVTTTVCRALGIPARSVTNFASAHDTDGSITIDVHFTEDGQLMDDRNEDTIWNFHVWNEAHMARPDLPAGYGGWQVIDATPQETSEGTYCCGPVSVHAIQKGEVNMPFDAPFVFAEVNADQVHWIIKDDGSMIKSKIEKNSIGKSISTKGINSEREDLTGHYKFPEGSQEERAAVLNANQTASTKTEICDKVQEDVSFSVITDDTVFVGEDVTVTMTMKNNSTVQKHLNGCRLTAQTTYYTGVPAVLCKTEIFSTILAAGETKTQTMIVKCEEYLEHLKDCCMMKISAMGKVGENEQVYTHQHEFRLQKPHLTIKAPKSAKVGEKITVEVSFTNTLPVTLTQCYIEVEGPGLGKPREIPESNVKPNQTLVSSFNLIPKKVGKREILVSFNSKIIDDINGSSDIVITK